MPRSTKFGKKEKPIKVNTESLVDMSCFAGVGKVEIWQLTNRSCHWPFDGLSIYGRRTYCGDATDDKRCYCQAHWDKSYKKKPKKDELQNLDDLA